MAKYASPIPTQFYNCIIFSHYAILIAQYYNRKFLIRL